LPAILLAIVSLIFNKLSPTIAVIFWSLPEGMISQAPAPLFKLLFQTAKSPTLAAGEFKLAFTRYTSPFF